MPDSSPDKKGGRSTDLTPGETKLLLMGALCSGGAKVDYEKLGSLMSMKRASASSMYTRAINKLEKVYGVPREGGSAKSPAKAPTKKASGQKRRKRNQDPDTESEADSDTKVKAKSENPEEAVEAKEEGVISFNDQLVG